MMDALSRALWIEAIDQFITNEMLSLERPAWNLLARWHYVTHSMDWMKALLSVGIFASPMGTTIPIPYLLECYKVRCNALMKKYPPHSDSLLLGQFWCSNYEQAVLYEQARYHYVMDPVAVVAPPPPAASADSCLYKDEGDGSGPTNTL